MAKTDDEAKTSKQTNRKIFVTDLHDMTVEQVRTYFAKYGTVTDVTILEPSLQSAFVTFETSEASQSVLKNCEHSIGYYHRIRVYEAISKPTDNHESECEAAPITTQDNAEDARCRQATCSVLVDKLPLNTTVKDIRGWFTKYGTITRVNINLPDRSMATVTFENLHMAQSLAEQEGQLEINGDLIHLELCQAMGRHKGRDEVVEFTAQSDTIPRMHNNCDQSDLADVMRDTLRLIQCLEPARGYASSMVSVYLNTEDSSTDDAIADLLMNKLEQEYQDTFDREFYVPRRSLEKSDRVQTFDREFYVPLRSLEKSDRVQTYGPLSMNLAAIRESIRATKECLQLNGTTSRRGRVIFCGTVFADGGEVRQVLVEFEPYTLISDKSFCYFDNKFHLGPLAFKLIHFQMGDGLRASDFKKVSEAFGGDQERSLASFNIDAPPNEKYVRDPIRFLAERSFFFGRAAWYPDIIRGARVAEVIRILRLIESLRVSGDDNTTKKMILIVRAREPSGVEKFLNSSLDLEEAKNAPSGLIPLFSHTSEWRNTAQELLKVGSFPGDLSAKRCFEFAEERLNLYSQVNTSHGLIIYCGLGMALNGREFKFSIELEPDKPVIKNKVIYIPNGQYDLTPLEELVFLEDHLVPFAFDPKNAPQGVMSHEKRDLLIRLVEELAGKPTIARHLASHQADP